MRVLERYDELVSRVHRDSYRVTTHGEPHRGNVIMTPDGPAVIDWDTTRRAPRERDLWSLIAQDSSVRAHYEELAGTPLDDDTLRLYELWWDLCEVSLFIHDFRHRHEHHADTETAWKGLTTHLDPSRWRDVLAT